MKVMTKYVVVVKHKLEELTDNVLYYAKKGYEAQGGVSLAVNQSNYKVFAQAMVKYSGESE